MSGINTGDCITGDADCDGNPGGSTTLPPLVGTDNADMDKGEYALIELLFASSIDFGSVTPSTAAVIGNPASTVFGSEAISNIRAARYPASGQSQNGFGTVIADVAVQYANSPTGPSTLFPNLEMSVANYSKIPAALGVSWDSDVGAVAMFAK